jgi:energy-coupling factor transporter ATP-binding protein EcfA2
VDPEAQNVTKRCLDAVEAGTYVLLAGARASGKSTRLIWLRQRLEVLDYWVL